MTAFLDIEMGGNFDQVNKLLRYTAVVFSTIGIATFMQAVVGPYIQDRTEKRFQSEGDDVSGPWAALQASTQEVRTRYQLGPDHPINVRTGEMEQWLTEGNWKIVESGFGVTLTYPGGTPNQAVQEKMRTAQIGRANPPTVPRVVLALNERDLAYFMSSLAFWYANGARVI